MHANPAPSWFTAYGTEAHVAGYHGAAPGDCQEARAQLAPRRVGPRLGPRYRCPDTVLVQAALPGLTPARRAPHGRGEQDGEAVDWRRCQPP